MFESWGKKKIEEKPAVPLENAEKKDDGAEELKASFDLRMKILKNRIDNFGEANNGIEKSTMDGVKEDLDMIDNIIKELKSTNGPELLEKLNKTLESIRESVDKNSNIEKEEAYSMVKRFVLDNELVQ